MLAWHNNSFGLLVILLFLADQYKANKTGSIGIDYHLIFANLVWQVKLSTKCCLFFQNKKTMDLLSAALSESGLDLSNDFGANENVSCLIFLFIHGYCIFCSVFF